MIEVINVNYLAVVVAAILHMALGFLWYGPLFGKMWMGMMGFTQKTIEEAKTKGGMGKNYAIALLGAFVTNWVLAYVVGFSGAATILEGMQAGFWVWLGFMATTTLSGVLWEGKSWKLYLLNNGHLLIGLLLSGAILAVWV